MKRLFLALLLALLIMPFAAAYGVTFYSPQQNPQYGKIYEKVDPDTPYVVEDTKDRDVAIRSVTFTIDREAKTAGITIYHLMAPPDNVPAVPENDSYEFNELKYSGFVPHDTKKLVYDFRVAKGWLENNSVARNHITLHVYESKTDKWDELPTAITGEDDTYVYFKAEGSGYHYFMIGKSQSGSEAAAAKIKTEVTAVDKAKPATAEQQELMDATSKVEQVKLDTAPQPAAAQPSVPPAPTGPAVMPSAPPEEGGSKMVGILVVLAVIILAVVLYLVFGKRKLTSSVDKELHNYIAESIKRGRSKEEVRQRLLDVGWHEERVEKALGKHKVKEEPVHAAAIPSEKPKPAPARPVKQAGAKPKAKKK